MNEKKAEKIPSKTQKITTKDNKTQIMKDRKPKKEQERIKIRKYEITWRK